MNEQGYSKLGTLFYLLIFAAAMFVVVNVAPFYYNYYAIENEMKAQAKRADKLGVAKIRSYLYKQMKRLGVPIDNENEIRIYREGDTVRIEYDYTEYLYLEWDGKYYDLHEFDFNVAIEEKIDYSKSKVW